MSEDDGQDMRAASLRRVRERQWVYLGPIAAAPLAHIAVSLYQATKSPQHKKIIMGVGVVGSTAATLYMRMYLMSHAGGGSIVSLDSMQSDVANQHIVLVDDEKRHQIQNPSTWDIAKQAMRGFA